tara:strand:- start:437 stop:676 length:240 start_codon:yes stop_codon:yes gene_type:complete
MKRKYTIDLTSVGNQSKKTKTFLENATNEETREWVIDQVRQGNIYIDGIYPEASWEDEPDFDEDQWELDIENENAENES